MLPNKWSQINGSALWAVVFMCVLVMPAPTPARAGEAEDLQNKTADKPAAAVEAPATQPSVNPPPAPLRKDWVVTVLQNKAPDTSAEQTELRQAKDALAPVEGRLDSARRTLDAARTRLEGYGYDYWWHHGVAWHQSERVQLDKAVADAKGVVDDLTNRETFLRGRVTHAEQALSAKKSKRLIEGKLDDDTPVRITGTGEAKATAEAMEEGRKYRVIGPGSDTDGVTRIYMRAAVPLDSQTSAAPAQGSGHASDAADEEIDVAGSNIVPWHEAGKLIGKNITAEGRVVSAHFNKQGMCILNFAEGRGTPAFFVVLTAEAVHNLPDTAEHYFVQKTIRATGEVEPPKAPGGHPHIVVTDSKQVSVVE